MPKYLFLVLGLVLAFPGFTQSTAVSKDTILMGSAFAFTAVHTSEKQAQVAIDKGIAEVKRIEALISSWSSTSETTLINKNAGIRPVKVSQELFDLIFRSKKISEISNGYFDISFASIDKVWKFNGAMTAIPSNEALKTSVAKINYQNIILDREKQTVFLKETGMKIGFGAIGKGYAADKAKALMQAEGITSGVVNAGGDLISWGTRPDGKPWSVGIADPEDKKNIISWLNVSDLAVVTSGNYERYVEIDGKKYCHIINPKTGWPVAGIKSVTILTANAEAADALATTVFVLGTKEGLKLIDHLQGVECIIVDDKNEMLYSKNVKLNLISKYEE
jgi:thiamine biosynthesis lipoprotein